MSPMSDSASVGVWTADGNPDSSVTPVCVTNGPMIDSGNGSKGNHTIAVWKRSPGLGPGQVPAREKALGWPTTVTWSVLLTKEKECTWHAIRPKLSVPLELAGGSPRKAYQVAWWSHVHSGLRKETTPDMRHSSLWQNKLNQLTSLLYILGLKSAEHSFNQSFSWKQREVFTSVCRFKVQSTAPQSACFYSLSLKTITESFIVISNDYLKSVIERLKN